MEINEELYNQIDLNAKVLVGILLKRIEVLEKEHALIPSLYKALVKESVYESARNLKTIIKIGKLIFKTKDSKE
jgi:hypothetical protein